MARRGEKTLAESMQYMFDNEISTDVCFEVGPPDGETVAFRAHKCILISRSEVFEGMFSSGMIECRSGPEATVRVEDIDADIFKEVLNYIYCERATMCPESAVHLMYAAKKYMLPKLVRDCVKYLSDGLTLNNVFNILEHSLRLNEQQLQTDCLKLISRNAKAVLTGAEILSSSPQLMEAILEVETLPVSESVIYETSLNWAKRQLQSVNPGENPTDLQIREILGDLLYKIRFPVMKSTEFAAISARNNVLTAEEKESVYSFFVTKKKDSQLKFPTGRRIGEELWIDRSLECRSGKWTATGDVEAINFTTDHDVMLTGIGLYTGFDGSGYEADVEILKSTNSLLKKRVTVPYSKFLTPFKISLDEPLVILAGVLYSVKATAHATIGRFGYACGLVCTKRAVTFMFSTNAESTYTTEARGQIPRLYFSCL